MSRKQRKRSLRDDRPWSALYEELQQGSDRAAAVIGGAMLDHSLSSLLIAFLVDDPYEIDSFLAGPLGSFNTKIRLAYSLGLITQGQAKDLLAIADIRNRFAHDLHDASFTYRPVAKLCEKLRHYERFMASRSNVPPRSLFQTAVGVLVYALAVHRMRQKHRQKLVAPSMRELLQQINLDQF